jgi:large subunit ribosomal protein L24
MARIRKGDLVEIVAGNERGKRGRVLRVIPDKDRVLVQGINLRWKHLRRSQKAPQGGRVRREASIHASNVMLYDEAGAVRSRVGFAVREGHKVRILRKTGQPAGTASASEKAAPKKTGKAAKPAKKPAKAKAAPAEERSMEEEA